MTETQFVWMVCDIPSGDQLGTFMDPLEADRCAHKAFRAKHPDVLAPVIARRAMGGDEDRYLAEMPGLEQTAVSILRLEVTDAPSSDDDFVVVVEEPSDD
jgi:hypothetical protein